MIGRAAPANPWIFRQIAQYTASGRYDSPTADDRYRMIRTYFEMLLAELPDTSRSPAAEAVGKMKQFASWFTHGVPGGAALRKSIFESKSGNAVLDAVDRFFGREGLAVQADSAPASVPALSDDPASSLMVCD
jgi:tRNA-dihydrouridine synthase